VEENVPEEGGEPASQAAKNGRVIPTLSQAGIGHHESPKLRAIAPVQSLVVVDFAGGCHQFVTRKELIS